mmetsp:Transcript_25083/g.58732  ORF Transcript_25083/g.58732 Transcript_25083/m.58732 type:complete len:272 (-) Transcript_25083:28-843(-)
MTIDALTFCCLRDVFDVNSNRITKKIKFFLPGHFITLIVLRTRAHSLHERSARRRHSSCCFGTTMEEGSHLSGLIRSTLLSPKSVGGELDCHLHVSIRTETRLLDVVATVTLETLHVQVVVAHKLVQMRLGVRNVLIDGRKVESLKDVLNIVATLVGQSKRFILSDAIRCLGDMIGQTYNGHAVHHGMLTEQPGLAIVCAKKLDGLIEPTIVSGRCAISNSTRPKDFAALLPRNRILVVKAEEKRSTLEFLQSSFHLGTTRLQKLIPSIGP